MKKLTVLLLISVSLLKAQTTIVIDSILPKTIMSAGFIYTPWYVSLNTKAKVYMHSTGTWSPSYPLTLKCNGVNQVVGTYQQLVDSGFVWPLTVPYCSSSSSTFMPVTIYAANVNYESHQCSPLEVKEYMQPNEIIKIETYSILGQKDDNGQIQVIYYSDRVVKKILWK